MKRKLELNEKSIYSLLSVEKCKNLTKATLIVDWIFFSRKVYFDFLFNSNVKWSLLR